MDIKTQNEIKESRNYPSGFCSSITNGFGIHQSLTDGTDLMPRSGKMQANGAEGLELAIAELRLGERIHNELKQQGRSVTWLARQLGMERTSLYYTFRQNSIDMELLLRISFYLGHNFMEDVVNAYKNMWTLINKM